MSLREHRSNLAFPKEIATPRMLSGLAMTGKSNARYCFHRIRNIHLTTTSISGNFAFIASSMHLLSHFKQGPTQFITARLSLTSTNSAQLSWADKRHWRLLRISLISSSLFIVSWLVSSLTTFYQKNKGSHNLNQGKSTKE